MHSPFSFGFQSDRSVYMLSRSDYKKKKDLLTTDSSHARPWTVKKKWLYLHIIEHSTIFSTCCYPVSTGISCRFEIQVFPCVCKCNTWAGNILMFRLEVTTKQKKKLV